MSDFEQPSPSESPLESSPRNNRARERHQRRKQKQQGMATPLAASVPRTALTPRQPRTSLPRSAACPINTKDFKMSEIPYLRQILLSAAGGAFMIFLIVLIGLTRQGAPQAPANALWLGQDWTQTTQTQEDMDSLVRQMRENEIGSVYAWVSWLQVNNTWAGTQPGTNTFLQVENEIQDFVTKFKATYPDADLYGWIQVPAVLGDAGNRLGNDDLQQTIAEFSIELTTRFGFDGIFLDVDTIANGSESYLAILRRIRAAVPEDALLAVALPPDWTPIGVDIPKPGGIEDGTAWDEPYKQRVALLADQLVIRAYNSYLETPEDYVAWMAYQVEAYAKAIDALATGAEVVIGIPTYDDELPAHDVRVENIDTAVRGIRQGLEQAGDARRAVEGVAIYADWQTDDVEWRQYQQQWLGK